MGCTRHFPRIFTTIFINVLFVQQVSHSLILLYNVFSHCERIFSLLELFHEQNKNVFNTYINMFEAYDLQPAEKNTIL